MTSQFGSDINVNALLASPTGDGPEAESSRGYGMVGHLTAHVQSAMDAAHRAAHCFNSDPYPPTSQTAKLQLCSPTVLSF